MESGTSAADTLTGATSADVHTGYGHPGDGMSSKERHGGKGKHVGSGLEGVGANSSDPIAQRGLNQDHETGYKMGSAGIENLTGAEGKAQ
jgi:hypothetical protein